MYYVGRILTRNRKWSKYLINPTTHENVTTDCSKNSHTKFRSTEMVKALLVVLQHCTI